MVTPFKNLEEDLEKNLLRLTEILSQRIRIHIENVKERARLDKELAFVLKQIKGNMRVLWRELAGGFLHNPLILKMIGDDRTPEVAYLHRFAIRFEEFYRGRQKMGGFSPLRNLIRILQRQERQKTVETMQFLEKEFQEELFSLHQYFQQYRNDFFTLLERETPRLLRIKGVGSDAPPYVISNIVGCCYAFVAGVRKRVSAKRARSTTLKAAVLAILLALNTAPQRHQKTPSEARRVKAKIELQTSGITSDQREVYIPVINDLIRRGILPYGYSGQDKIETLFQNIISGRTGSINDSKTGREIGSPAREDAWRIYLGIPQQHNTFGISDYVPDNYVEAYCYKINDWFGMFFSGRDPSQWLKEYHDRIAAGFPYQDEYFGDVADVMGAHTVRVGRDHRGTFLYYYDVWDLNVPLERDDGFFGKPFVIYDRLYFDPVTFQLLKPLKIVPVSNSIEHVVM